MSPAKRTALLCTIVGATAGLDQLTKAWARAGLPSGPPLTLAGGLVRLAVSDNVGAFMGVGAAFQPAVRTLFFGILASFILIGATVLVLTTRRLTWFGVTSASLLIGGGLGNLIDRVARQGAVTDFLNVGIGGFRTGIFNLADMAIVLGSAGLIVSSWRTERPPDKPSQTV